ncbi:MAG: heavy-metal-associated domain-containing protein [Robiginitomaculum sp.]|nr:heavy-metal-associated domain-containing protein [Robiginitomaculum sp.]MDQ7076955.1 heavy-metal-associated domain-containing protein [Robiginitomaculum sp.]
MFKTLTLSLGLIMLAGSAMAGETGYTLQVDGMTCPFCVATSEKALKKIKGVKGATADLKTGVINVCTDGSVNFTDDQLKALFLEKGFTYRQMTKTKTCAAAAPSKVTDAAAG